MARKKTTKAEPKPPDKAPENAPKPAPVKGGEISKEVWDELLAASVEQAKSQKAYSEAHIVAKAAKDALDAATDRIIEILKEARTGQARLPFDQKAEDWRGAKFSDRTKFPGLGSHLAGVLHEANIDTIGQLADRQKDSRFRLHDVKGIGEKAQTLIEDACLSFHKARKAEADKAKKAQAAG